MKIKKVARKVYLHPNKVMRRGVSRFAFTFLPFNISNLLVRRREGSIILVTNASAIKKKVPTENKKKLTNKFMIDGINWSEISENVCEKTLHPTIKEMFMLDKHYTETEQYRKMITAVDAYNQGEIDDPAPAGGYWCKSREDVSRYFEILLKCYCSIKNSGYKTQEQLFKETGKMGPGNTVRNLSDEIELLVDEAGDLVFAGTRANHRFSIAQVLNVERLPVVLGGIDKNYIKENLNYRNRSLQTLVKDFVLSHENLEHFSAR